LIGDRTDGNLRPRHLGWSLLRTGAAVITGVCAFYAFATLPLAQTYAILFASPLLITMLAIPILGEKVGIRRGLAVLVGLIGVMIVLRPGQVELRLGHLAAITAAVTGALASIIVRKIGNDERSAVLLLFPMLANFVCMGAMLPFVFRPMPLLHLAGLALIAAMALVAGLCLIAAYRKAEAVIVAPMQYSQILWATVYGYFIFGEAPGWPTGIGAGIIILSGIYIVLREGSGISLTRPVLRTKSRAETGTTPRISQMMHVSDEERASQPAE
jgi:S-adenosylmethionine uptake transporter